MIEDVGSLLRFLEGAHTVHVAKAHMGKVLLVAYYGKGPKYPHEAEKEEWVDVQTILNAIEDGRLDIDRVLSWFTDPYTSMWFETWAWISNVGEIEALDVEAEASFNPEGYWEAKSITVTFSTAPDYVVLRPNGDVVPYRAEGEVKAGIPIKDSLLWEEVAEVFNNYPLKIV